VKPSQARFAHAGQTALPSGVHLVSSYHCSRYNTQTNRLTAAMFEAVMMRAREAALA
jgi:uracil-DNA glycosylase